MHREKHQQTGTTATDIRIELARQVHIVGPCCRWVLPELSSIDYSRVSFDRLAVLAEPLDGPSFHTFGALAREFETVIVHGLPRRKADACYISQVVVDAHGRRIGFYDKLSLPIE